MYQSVGYWEYPFSRSRYKKLDKKGVSNCVGTEVLVLVTMNKSSVMRYGVIWWKFKNFFARILELEMEAEGSSKMLGLSQTIVSLLKTVFVVFR